MPDLGWQELAIILVIVIIIFGAGKLPEIGSAAGKSIKEFKKATTDETPELTARAPSRSINSGAVTTTGIRAEDI